MQLSWIDVGKFILALYLIGAIIGTAVPHK